MKGKKKILLLLLTLIMVFGMSMTVYAEENTIKANMPKYDSCNPNYGYNMVLFEDGLYYYVTSNKPFVVSSSSGNLVIQKTSGTQFMYSKLLSDNHISNQWGDSLYGTNEWANAGASTTLVDANYTIYYSDGETVFFPPPPPMLPIIQKITEIPVAVTNQVIMIVTIAVSCLALLVVLLTLRKKLPIFLLR